MSETAVPYYGVELEVDGGKRNPAGLRDLMKLAYQTGKHLGQGSVSFYIKRDGSLSSEGLEIVTHPCTCAYHTSDFPWNPMVEILHANNYKTLTKDDVGIHISTTFRQRTSMLYSAFVNVAADRFWIPLARRRSRYAEFVMPGRSTTLKDFINSVRQHAKYSATNFKNHLNCNLVETRIFKTLVDADSIRAYIQAVHYAHTFVENLPYIAVHKGWKDATWWVEEWKKYLEALPSTDAVHLKAFITKNKIMELKGATK